MKNAFLVLTALSMILGSFANLWTAEARSYRSSSSDTYVHGYYKSNGTYVKPYYRSKSDGVKSNNYSCLDYGRCR